MEINDLISLGLNSNEAKVYFELIKLKKCTARQIIKLTKFHQNIVYDNLNKLIDKGLISYIKEDSKTIFQLAPPYNLIEFISKKEKEILEKKEKAEKISLEIKRIFGESLTVSEATIYRGVNGIKSFYAGTLEDTHDFFLFGAPFESIRIMGETFWKNYEVNRLNKKIKGKMIFNTSAKEYGKTLVNKKDIRYFEENFEPLTETFIQGNKVAIIVWANEPLLFLIKDQQIAESYKGYFKKLWKSSKITKTC